MRFHLLAIVAGFITASLSHAQEDVPPFLKMKKIQAGVVTLHQPMRVNHDFWIMEHEVTQEQFQAAVGDNPAKFSNSENCRDKYFSIGADKSSMVPGLQKWIRFGMSYCRNLPVESMSADNAIRFIDALNYRAYEEGLGWYFSLPSAAEWLLAAGPINEDTASQQGCVAAEGPSAIESHQPNANGVYDMFGNVAELLLDTAIPGLVRSGQELNDPIFRPGNITFRIPPAPRVTGAPGEAYRLFPSTRRPSGLQVYANFSYLRCMAKYPHYWFSALKTDNIGRAAGSTSNNYEYESAHVGFRVVARRVAIEEAAK